MAGELAVNQRPGIGLDPGPQNDIRQNLVERQEGFRACLARLKDLSENIRLDLLDWQL